MPSIHPTAIIDPEVSLADDVTIGPHCVLSGNITIGAGTTLIGNVYLTGKLDMGESNVVYPFTSIGFAAQDVNFPSDLYEPGIVIGNNNTFREGVTIHRATQERPTTIGHHNLFMTTSHAGHDCQIGNHNTIVTDVSLGGHVHMDDHIIIGGGTVIHQFVSIGKGAMIAGGIFITGDVAPHFMATGSNIIGSVNLVGMRRKEIDREEIKERQNVYKLIYRSGNSIAKSIEALQALGTPTSLEYVAFIEQSRKGLVAPLTETRKSKRGVAQ
ncbi:MAG: acyl-ACP--UDP-N-acetylglucosamine O-acyltransferase [Planctomycetota bacterium]|nr:acyl-ACP--UDP-N-acetylglucosamine O-acyltransferase [Planctomycetota bacterium]